MKKGRTLKGFFFNKSLHIVRGAGGALRRVYGEIQPSLGRGKASKSIISIFLQTFRRIVLRFSRLRGLLGVRGGGVQIK